MWEGRWRGAVSFARPQPTGRMIADPLADAIGKQFPDKFATQ